jgi:hypothetical protein
VANGVCTRSLYLEIFKDQFAYFSFNGNSISITKTLLPDKNVKALLYFSASNSTEKSPSREIDSHSVKKFPAFMEPEASLPSSEEYNMLYFPVKIMLIINYSF